MTDSLLSTEWLSRLQHYKQLIVGFSGGLDSTVLLHLCASLPALKKRLLAVHINHGLSPNALSWQKHCKQWCSNRHIPFVAQAVDFNRAANIEEEARAARYAVFQSLIQQEGCLLLGHHKDDQAETLLLNLFRGAGIDGLAAMPSLSSFFLGTLARPLLSCTRGQLHDYAVLHQLHWIDDESNEDSHYSRNYVRHQILPVIAKKWPRVVANLSQTIEHCQKAQMNLQALAFNDYQALEKPTRTLNTALLKNLSEERLVNVLRVWLKKNEIKSPSTVVYSQIIQNLIHAAIDANPVVRWDKVSIRRYQDTLYLEWVEPREMQDVNWFFFPKPITLDNTMLHAIPTKKGLFIPVGAQVSIKYRKGGECFIFRGQNKSLKKLLQEWQIPPWLRAQIPLLYINDQLAAVIGYAVSDLFFVDNQPAWIINRTESLLC